MSGSPRGVIHFRRDEHVPGAALNGAFVCPARGECSPIHCGASSAAFSMFHIGTIAGLPTRPVRDFRRAIGAMYFPDLTSLTPIFCSAAANSWEALSASRQYVGSRMTTLSPAYPALLKELLSLFRVAALLVPPRILVVGHRRSVPKTDVSTGISWIRGHHAHDRLLIDLVKHCLARLLKGGCKWFKRTGLACSAQSPSPPARVRMAILLARAIEPTYQRTVSRGRWGKVCRIGCALKRRKWSDHPINRFYGALKYRLGLSSGA
ncbi:hypothetical protein ABID25_006725 [Mesorhizobium abyssinicae]